MKTMPDLVVVPVDDVFRVIEAKTGLIWRTLPTRSSAEAWLAQCVREVEVQ